MKKAGILSVGDEILNGQIVDTNASYLSGKLLSVGIPVAKIYAVGDQIESIVRAIKLAIDEVDLVFITGGLGPTDDDLTRQALSDQLNVKLQFKEELFQQIKDFFTRRGLQMPAKNKVQAYIPAGSQEMINRVGTAPGIKVRVGNKSIFAMPGVPSEMQRMFEESVLPELRKIIADSHQPAIVVRKLKCFGASEAIICELLGDMMQRGRNPLINSTAVNGIVTLHIIATAKNEAEAEQMVQKKERALRVILADLVYGIAEQSLAEIVGEKLAKTGKKVATAESCTGGILAKMLTDVPGASAYFSHGWVTYSNKAKIQELGVPVRLLERYGSVSEQVAEAMSKSARGKSGTTFAIGITGIAGPTGGSKQKPVGLVYISIDTENECEVKRFIFPYDRESIRLRTANTALNMLRLKLNI